MQGLRLILAASVAACVVTLIGCGGAASPAPGEIEEARFEGAEIEGAAIPPAELARARDVADDLTRDLGGLVMSTMAEQGAVAAIEVCSGVAQDRTAAHSGDGVLVRRVANRLRNPLNAPDPSEARELDRWEAQVGENRSASEVVRLVRDEDGRTLHYLRPITIAPPCLACHGAPEEIVPEVRTILHDRYPEDAATGYAVGDLRGAVSVRVPLAGGSPDPAR
jgi:hypothetical protein